MKLAGRHVIHLNFRLDPPEESFVAKRSGVKVGCKGYEKIEGNFNLFPAGQIQEVNSPIERDDPAVKHILRAHSLPSKVIDNKNTIVGLHLKRGGVKLCERVHLQVQHLERQLASDNHPGPAA